MKFQQLYALIALVDAGSMHGAARALGLTQPALSTRISELEREIGATLVNRNARGTTLTSVGHALLGHARTICNQVDRAQTEMNRLTQSSAASVSLGASPLAAGELIAPLFGALQSVAPNVHLKVTEGQFHDLAMELREGGLEMIIAPIPPGNKDTKAFRFEELVTYPMFVVARSGHRLAGCKHLSELGGAGWVVGAATNASRSTVEELFASHGLPPPRVELHSDAISLVQACLLQTDLLGLLPRPLFAALASAVVPLPIEDDVRQLRLGIITLAGVQLTPVAQAFLGLVRQRCQTIAKSLADARSRTPRRRGG